MEYRFRSAEIIEEWSHRAYVFCAVWVGPALAVTQLITPVDQMVGGRISAFAPWIGLIVPLLVSLGMVVQFYVMVGLGVQAWQAHTYGKATLWFLGGAPNAVFLVLTGAAYGMENDLHISENAALAQFHLTYGMIVASTGLLATYATFIGGKIAHELKERKSANKG